MAGRPLNSGMMAVAAAFLAADRLTARVLARAPGMVPFANFTGKGWLPFRTA